MHSPLRTAFCAAILFAATLSVQAEIKLPAIFGDHMVLQEGVKVPVWGTASPGEKITVIVGTQSVQTTAGADGKWSATLAPLTRSAVPTLLTVTGKTSVTFSDVLIGDVWLCSGQSNMEFDLGGGKSFGGASNADTAVPAANDPQLRLFLVQKKTSLQPLSDVVGKWQLCTPDAAALFSAVGYFFGRDLRTALNKPIGLIGSYWGGTPAQAWTSLSGLQKDPVLQHYVAAYQKTVADFDKNTAAYPGLLAAYKAKVEPMIKAGAARKTLPLPPQTPDGGARSPANLYNGMIAPLVPYAIKGVIWYQGEANAGVAAEYAKLFPDMITDWRTQWNQGDFPFLFVQLARYKSQALQNWPFLRESQLTTLSLPDTGMAVAVDIGDPANIHPKDKDDVGHRLALAARHIAYSEDLVYSGPIYDSMKVDGSTVVLNFKNSGNGLIIGSAPWVAAGQTPIPTTSLVGFAVAGADHQWAPAEAKIVGDTVVVSSPQVPQPVDVRYDWANTPEGNLYNKDGLPASPFRTDHLPFDPKVDVIAP